MTSTYLVSAATHDVNVKNSNNILYLTKIALIVGIPYYHLHKSVNFGICECNKKEIVENCKI